uniref:Unidentified protein n=1 Tax=Nephroselmis olivacea TaxID=31312 RepID=Q9TCA1_NEPOL|nr:unidentified protein [Nephroselmis olivacea]AAF03196.1 unidentified protein [Nephroselmis olivacea]
MPFSLTRENLILFGFGFLAFITLSSKRIILYNAEILVALSFLLFLLFSLTYFRESVEDMFVARSESIQTDFQAYLDQKRKWLYLLTIETALSATKAPNQLLSHFSSTQGATIAKYQESNLQNRIISGIADKLETLEVTNRAMERKVQSGLGKGLRSGVLEEYSKSKGGFKKKFLQFGVSSLKKV